MRDLTALAERRRQLQAASALLRHSLAADAARVGDRVRLAGRVVAIARSGTARRLLRLVVRLAVSRRRRRLVGWVGRLIGAYPLVRPLVARLLRRR